MLYVYGHRLYGKIDECGTTYLATRFFHIWFIPLIPLGTDLVLFRQGKDYRFFPQPFSGRSILAALLRTWGVFFLLVPGLPLFIGAFVDPKFVHPVPVVLWFLLHAAAVVYSFFRLGQLSPVEKAQRMVYSSFVDYPVDVARVKNYLPGLRKNVRDELNRLAQALDPTGPRGAASGFFDHAARALDPKMVDVDYLRAALVLTRLEWAETHGREREKRAEQHAAIWAKLERQSVAPARGQERERRAPQREWVEIDQQGGAPARVTVAARPSPAPPRMRSQPFSAARAPLRPNQSWRPILIACLLGAGLIVAFGFVKGYRKANERVGEPQRTASVPAPGSPVSTSTSAPTSTRADFSAACRNSCQSSYQTCFCPRDDAHCKQSCTKELQICMRGCPQR